MEWMTNSPKWRHDECLDDQSDYPWQHFDDPCNNESTILIPLTTSGDYLWWLLWQTSNDHEQYMTKSDYIWWLRLVIFITKVNLCLSCCLSLTLQNRFCLNWPTYAKKYIRGVRGPVLPNLLWRLKSNKTVLPHFYWIVSYSPHMNEPCTINHDTPHIF